MSFGTNTIMAQNINPTQTLTTGSGTSGSSIKIDGTAGTITSPSGSVGFGSNNITTTGTISAGAFNVSNLNATTSITAPAITTDRIKPMLADSIIHMGDSSFNFQVAGIAQGNIWYTPNFVGAPAIRIFLLIVIRHMLWDLVIFLLRIMPLFHSGLA